jgi:hypothetical protein
LGDNYFDLKGHKNEFPKAKVIAEPTQSLSSSPPKEPMSARTAGQPTPTGIINLDR